MTNATKATNIGETRMITGATREAIQDLKVGDKVSMTFDTAWGKPVAGARWSEFREVARITYRGISIKGQAYVGVDVKHGDNGTMGFAIGEDDEHRFKIERTR